MARKTRYRSSDAFWQQFQQLIPEHRNTHRFGGGRPRVPDRDCLGPKRCRTPFRPCRRPYPPWHQQSLRHRSDRSCRQVCEDLTRELRQLR